MTTIEKTDWLEGIKINYNTDDESYAHIKDLDNSSQALCGYGSRKHRGHKLSWMELLQKGIRHCSCGALICPTCVSMAQRYKERIRW